MVEFRSDGSAPSNAGLTMDMIDRIEIRELLENWVVWRDAGDFEKFATLWCEGGRMNATWFQADAVDFTARAKKAFEAGMIGLHLLGGSSIQVRGARAVAQTKMQLIQRDTLEGHRVEVTCTGRFVDALQKAGAGWAIMLRQPVYEIDRIQSIDPLGALVLDRDLLDSFPEGYRHLAYLQTKLGFSVSRDLPGTRGPAIGALMSRMARWLEGEDKACLAS
jgi:hypothetical protein